MKCASVRPALILPVLAPASIEMSIAHHDDNDNGEGDDDGDDGDEVEKQKNYQMFPLLESSSTEMSTPENSFTLNK